MNASNPQRALAEFVGRLRYDHLPSRVHTLLPVLLIDFVRAAAVGKRQVWSAKAADVLMRESGTETCRILFSDRRADPVRAAYLNGVIGGSLDWDDSHIAAIIHPGVVIWPAVLAAAEISGADGRAIIEAAAAGYETAVRIGMSIQPDHALRGFQGTPTCGVFGAAVAACRLLGGNVDALQNALGLAASYSSGLSQFFISGSDVKRLHAGKAAAGGVEIALLVQAGLSGPPDAIEGMQGFGQAVSNTFNPEYLTKDLGSHYWLESIALKVHAGTVRLQASIEAAEILARRGIHPEDIDHIEIGVPRILMGKLTWNAPVDQQQAQMSAPFAVAMTFFLAAERSGPLILGIDEFGEMARDDNVHALSHRTNCAIDEEMDTAMTKEYVPSRVTAFLRSGQTETAKIMVPKGARERPITDDEVCERFEAVLEGTWPVERSNAWIHAVKNLHKLHSIEELFTYAGEES